MKCMTTEECLNTFIEASSINAKEGQEFRNRNAVCAVLGVSRHAGYAWFERKVMPVGEYLLKLRLFLTMNGYKPAERQGLPVMVRECADQVALEVITVDDVAKYLGLSRDSVMRILTGKAGTSPERLELLRGLIESNHGKMLEKSRQWKLVVQSRQEPVQDANGGPAQPLSPAVSREVAISMLSLMTTQLGIVEKVLAGNGQSVPLLDGDLMRAIEVAIRLLKVFGISPQVVSRLQKPEIMTEADPLFSTLNEFAKLATGKE